ncbi:MAG: 7TM diverse intracellular signaling domain-containing protein [Spirosomataceae bacterium]
MYHRCLYLFCFTVGVHFSGPVMAQSIIPLSPHFDKVSLSGQLYFETDYTDTRPFEQVSRHFKGKPVVSSEPNFGDSPHPHWLRFGVRNTATQVQRISLITKSIDSLQVVVTDTNLNILHVFQSGSHYPMAHRSVVGPFLSVSFEVPPDSTYWIWARIRNVHYRLAASPFTLFSQPEGQQYLYTQYFFYSIFIGSMFLFLLLGLFLGYFFKEKIYWYYFGCVVCALSIMMIYNDFTYLLADHLPAVVRNKDILGILSATVPVFYLLFAEQFLEINPLQFSKTIRWSRAVIGLQYGCMLVLMAAQQTLFEYKLLFYLFMGGLSSITLIYLVYSWPSPQAKLFIFATLPVTVTVLIETTSDIHQWPVQQIHNSYYATTFIELLVLTSGIVYRFKNNEREKYQLQNEILHIEFNTQRKERNQIADEMHNDLGGLLMVTKLKLQLLSQTAASKALEEIEVQLSDIYRKVRDISHRLRTEEDAHLMSLLTDRYKRVDMIDFSFEGLERFRFNSETEALLFSIISEVITNAIKHSRCHTVNVQVNYEKPSFTVIVEDDGTGFDVKANLDKKSGGLCQIERRVLKNLKGTFRVDSSSKGTVVIIKAHLLPI